MTSPQESPKNLGFSTLARVGQITLVVGVLVLCSMLLNLAGVDFEGFWVLDELPGGRLVLGLPLTVVGWIMFVAGGGRATVKAQRRHMRGE